MLTQQQLDVIYEDLGRPFHIIWSNVEDVHGLSTEQLDPDSFEERKNDFLFLIGKLLDEGLLKLGDRKSELIIEGTTTELVERFRKCFPALYEEVNLAGVGGLWLVTQECPFIAVWVYKGENCEDEYEWAF
ncbi:DUF596 domain-containing protein [Xylella fastidiosa]|uniref:DUF596 domain-containing protein n=1 Tax=Xylella fastidiosa TaxID=2371 RepID=UPI0003D37561|nr:DUF596 domain-containing protein [Xylella fastidiosa]ALR05215.1 DUF596 domain-containing protein [Xylella fastidiosa]KXB18831.1 hypothetical protein ADT30_09990 [Xylella fastidiosa]OJZ69222.1 hypothetical protein B375_0211485 [Xylella fastidiosa 6c]WGZ32739.1 DUF596 domain-containing protein [Xylella fastidiosa subsp. pauca]WGZ35068.1 DUF596 domain-containing protein [Xylella fastidiosa subsp. pauca]